MSEDKKRELGVAIPPKPKKPNTNGDGSGDGAPDGIPPLKCRRKKDEPKKVKEKAETKPEVKPTPTHPQPSSTGTRNIADIHVPPTHSGKDENDFGFI